MAAMSFQTQGSEATDHHHRGCGHTERGGIGWNESSWDLMRGLDVIEHPSLEAWSQNLASV